jgi:hypothetical protein
MLSSDTILIMKSLAYPEYLADPANFCPLPNSSIRAITYNPGDYLIIESDEILSARATEIIEANFNYLGMKAIIFSLGMKLAGVLNRAQLPD